MSSAEVTVFLAGREFAAGEDAGWPDYPEPPVEHHQWMTADQVAAAERLGFQDALYWLQRGVDAWIADQVER